MDNINELIKSVKTSRKKTGVLYCSGSFDPIIKQFEVEIPNIKFLDCTKLYNHSLTFSAGDFLNKIEDESNDKSAIVVNMETFIISNSSDYSKQLARLLTFREPSNPLFFLFYSKKIYREFKDQFEAKELNKANTIEF